ncbi:MAG TPA: hypothetical protein VHB21_12800 [Minicystis sp.]|nr:hypothetical protein [Minicystis sp.]
MSLRRPLASPGAPRRSSLVSALAALALALAAGGAASAGCSNKGGGGSGGSGGSGAGGGGLPSPTSSSGTDATSTSTGTGGSGGSTAIVGSGGSSSMGTGGAGGGGGTGGGCVGPIPPDANGTPAMDLADTGLYTDIANGVISPDVQAYAPQFTLWADGAGKNRWAYIPPCAKIDNTNEDHWVFPVGTRFWKEFAVDTGGPTPLKIETRMIEHYALGPQAWLFVTYAWTADGTDATLVPDGMEIDDALGTEHDIPTTPGQCRTCHGANEIDRVNGFSAIQLSGAATGLDMAALSQQGLLLHPHPQGYTVPGDATAQAALGYLHANCGHCHNDYGMAPNGLFMRLSVADTDVTATQAYVTGVNVPVANYSHPGITFRIQGQDATDSCVHFRMSQRGDPHVVPYQNSPDQMPPFATKEPDPDGLAAIAAWIDSLPAPP